MKLRVGSQYYEDNLFLNSELWDASKQVLSLLEFLKVVENLPVFCFILSQYINYCASIINVLMRLILQKFCSEPRGFGFVQYVEPADAAEAKYQMDGQVFHGRELTVVFAEENRKKPAEMRAREHTRYCISPTTVQVLKHPICRSNSSCQFAILKVC